MVFGTGVMFSLPQVGYEEKVWDHAPGSLLVDEAGGVVSDVHGRALDFSRGQRLRSNEGLIVSDGKFHQEVLDATAAALRG